ncbi:2-oxoglutarate ferredoxin oxidoreductase subunit beta, partial [Campylobacter jejuni]|nr:2-oxoglutarate ferredoxin oxidoreductase subunit beta [Campylobacter jejuni]MCG4133683.1 2-oxoglutarate ferredoxin oxidoreductase subunit beta [Campylobacter jejuni]
LTKFESMDFEERKDKFPTGILHEDNSQPEYCHAYEEVRRAAKEKRMVDLGALK